MPFRGTLPKLSVKFSSKPSTSSVFSPPSAGTPTASSRAGTPHPMTPPARLHLRNVLPTSPDYLPTPPPPPPQPRPWVWQCHGCLTIWRLSSTRRCLVCSHEYCTSASRLAAGGRSGGRKRRRRNGPGSGGTYCRAEFDYQGWEEWGAWRRKVLGLEARTAQPQRDRAFLHRAHDCWLDCDYPSQCHHERAQLAAEAAVAAAAASSNSGISSPYCYTLTTVVEEEQTELSPPAVESPASLTSPDDYLLMNEALDIAQELDQQIAAAADEQKSPTSPKSPLGQTNFFPDSDQSEKKKKNTTASTGTVTTPTKSREQLWWKPVQEQKSHVGRNSRAADAKGMSSVVLMQLIRDDQNMMPLEYSNYDSIKSSGGQGKLTVRNLADSDDMDSVSLLSSSSSGDDDCFSDDSDEGYEMADADLSSVEDSRTTEEIERDLRLLIESTTKSYSGK